MGSACNTVKDLDFSQRYYFNEINNKSESGFKVGEKMEGIWIWGKPISLNDDTKLLILDCQGIKNIKY